MLYFDSAATTAPCREALSAASEALGVFGNPSSVHSAGLAARKITDSARAAVAASLYCRPEEVVFTGCGSESNNQALYGLAELRSRRSRRIITTDSEHPSVSSPLALLESRGYEIIKIPTLGGALDIPALEAQLQKGAAFVAIMLANNETGAEYDIAAVRRAIEKSGCGALFHCDAVQGYLKTADRRAIAKNCDTASLSAHKIGGLKGVGALYVKSGLKLPPFIRGGGQENGLRSGTENVAGIAAFGSAAKAFTREKLEKIEALYAYTAEKLSEHGELLSLNIPERRIKTVLSVSLIGVRSEVMLNALSAEGICISAGSACSARKGPSGALTAFGLTKKEIEGTVRISFGADNTGEECDLLIERLVSNAKRLKR